MIVWIILFLLIAAVSFILALRSMHNFSEKTEHFQFHYSQFLVTEPSVLTEQCLTELYQALLPKRALFSLERLTKGSRQALVIYGPVELLQPFFGRFKLLELEDYTADIEPASVTAWQFTGHPTKPVDISVVDNLTENQQLWLQITLQPVKPGIEMAVKKTIMGSQARQSAGKHIAFTAVMRMVLVDSDPKKREVHSQQLAKQLSSQGLIKLPQKFTSQELLIKYHQRSLAVADTGSVIIGVPALQFLLRE